MQSPKLVPIADRSAVRRTVLRSVAREIAEVARRLARLEARVLNLDHELDGDPGHKALSRQEWLTAEFRRLHELQLRREQEGGESA